jgi:hypothetical protein
MLKTYIRTLKDVDDYDFHVTPAILKEEIQLNPEHFSSVENYVYAKGKKPATFKKVTLNNGTVFIVKKV